MCVCVCVQFFLYIGVRVCVVYTGVFVCVCGVYRCACVCVCGVYRCVRVHVVPQTKACSQIILVVIAQTNAQGKWMCIEAGQH